MNRRQTVMVTDEIRVQMAADVETSGVTEWDRCTHCGEPTGKGDMIQVPWKDAPVCRFCAEG